LQIANPFEVFLDLSGNPLSNGKIFVGVAGADPESSPIAVYFDEALTIPATQPIRTVSGYPASGGTPADLFVAESAFSIRARTSLGVQVFYTATASTLEARLAASSGSSLVSYLQSGANATARTAQARLREKRSFKDSAATGDGITNDGANLRKQLTDADAQGEKLWLPKGTYIAGASGGAVLTLAAPISIEGDGRAASIINPSSAISTDDTIKLSPNLLYDHSGIRLAGFALHNPSTGLRTGRHGIYLDTMAAGQALAGLTIEDVEIGEGSGWAIYHDNDPVDNPNGGLYGATIQRSQLKGGMKLAGSGDSITVSGNIISGGNLGLDVSLVDGASVLTVEKCNITNANGAIRHRAGSRPSYTRLNIENFTLGALANNAGAVVYISGEDDTIVGGSLTDSLVSAFGTSNATHLVKIANTRGFTLDRLTLLGDFFDGTGSVSGTTMTVTAITSGAVSVGQTITGTGVTAGSYVVAQLTGATGGIGTYTLSAASAATGAITLAGKTIAIEIAADAFDTVIGNLQMQDTNNDGTFDLAIIDNGVGTMGFIKTPALQNGWVALNGTTSTLKMIKSVDGVVKVWGSIKSGTVADGTLIATLDVGFRPSEIIRAPAIYKTTVPATTPAWVYVGTDGTIKCEGLTGTAAELTFNFSFPALTLGHSDMSPEAIATCSR
jgi:hypothetical protein